MTRTAAPRVIAAGNPEAIPAAVAALRDGLLVAIPTETVYGLACAPVERSLRRLVEAKVRSPDKGIALLLDSPDQAAALAVMPSAARSMAARFWPGPLTLVLAARPEADLPALMRGPAGTLGFRVPDHRLARALARAAGPLALTSANRSGEKEARSALEVVGMLGTAVALVIDGGVTTAGVPSTVVEVLKDGSPRVLREGAIGTADVHAAVR
ncbi:hypothetical protein BH20CHL6_BH20CHL6_05460 [soil metagenome]